MTPTGRDALAREYHLTENDASWLASMVQMPPDIRREALAAYTAQNGLNRLLNLFTQFIGMANAVVMSAHEAIEIFGIVEGGHHPHASNWNLPTITGACNGAILADGIIQHGLCGGCAFRLGTLANQSPITTCDADWCGHLGEEPFLCHEVPAGEEPSKACVGFARLRARRRREAA